MGTKAYLIVTCILFVIISVLHLLRLIYQWPAQIGTVSMPIWASCAGLLIATALWVWAFLLIRKNIQ